VSEHRGGPSGFAEGDELPPLRVTLTRTDLVRYAGASGDYNPIHWSDRVATTVALPGVVAHGMLTMALVGRVVTGWLGSPAAVRSLQVRFTRPVPVPDVVDGVDVIDRAAAPDHGAVVELSGTLRAIETVDGVRTGRVDLKAVFDGKTVLGRASALVTLPA
jgi:acyl dehydratase